MIIGFVINYNSNKLSNSYQSIDARFIGIDADTVQCFGHDYVIYKQNYEYQVNGTKYNVLTKVGTDNVPSYGYVKTVRYNKSEPLKSVVKEFNLGYIFIGFGIFYLFLGILSLFFKNIKNKYDFNSKIYNILFGLPFLITGIIVLYCMCFSINSISINFAIKNCGIFTILPFALIVFGIYNTILAFCGRETVSLATVEKIKKINSLF